MNTISIINLKTKIWEWTTEKDKLLLFFSGMNNMNVATFCAGIPKTQKNSKLPLDYPFDFYFQRQSS